MLPETGSSRLTLRLREVSGHLEQSYLGHMRHPLAIHALEPMPNYGFGPFVYMNFGLGH